jgi:hypothetical protein
MIPLANKGLRRADSIIVIVWNPDKPTNPLPLVCTLSDDKNDKKYSQIINKDQTPSIFYYPR